MKRLIAAAILLLVLFCLIIIGNFSVSLCCRNLNELLTVCKNEPTAQNLEALSTAFKKYKPIFSAFCEQSPILDISEGLARMRAKIYDADSDFYAECEQINFNFKLILASQHFSLENLI